MGEPTTEESEGSKYSDWESMWSIGERKFGYDVRKREIERVQENYF